MNHLYLRIDVTNIVRFEELIHVLAETFPDASMDIPEKFTIALVFRSIKHLTQQERQVLEDLLEGRFLKQWELVTPQRIITATRRG